MWCRLGPQDTAPEITADARLLMMYLDDDHGQLQVPVRVATTAVTRSPHGEELLVSFTVLPGALRVQRRGHFRQKDPLVEIAIVVRSEVAPECHVATRPRDLGAGGVAIEVPRGEFRVGDTVELALQFADGTRVPAIGEIVRSGSTPTGGPMLGIRFTAIDEEGRHRIASQVSGEHRVIRIKQP